MPTWNILFLLKHTFATKGLQRQYCLDTFISTENGANVAHLKNWNHHWLAGKMGQVTEPKWSPHTIIMWPQANYQTFSYATPQFNGIFYITFHHWPCVIYGRTKGELVEYNIYDFADSGFKKGSLFQYWNKCVQESAK